MIADILSNNKNSTIVPEFYTGRKLDISLVSITQTYFPEPKKYLARSYALFYFENSKQRVASTISIELFITYWPLAWPLMIRLERKKYNINRNAAKISELLSGKIDKSDIDKDILPSC